VRACVYVCACVCLYVCVCVCACLHVRKDLVVKTESCFISVSHELPST